MAKYLCIGAICLDTKNFNSANEAPKLCLGGVSYNIHANLSTWGVDSTLLTAISDDKEGEFLRSQACAKTNFVISKSYSSSYYKATFDKDGNPYNEQGDVDVQVTVNYMEVLNILQKGSSFDYIISDLNHAEGVLEKLSCEFNMKLIIVPACLDNLRRLSIAKLSCPIDLLILNKLEFSELIGKSSFSNKEAQQYYQSHLSKNVLKCIITLGDQGSLYLGQYGEIFLQRAKLSGSVIDTTGAGDAFSSSAIFHLIERGEDVKTSLNESSMVASKLIEIADSNFQFYSK